MGSVHCSTTQHCHNLYNLFETNLVRRSQSIYAVRYPAALSSLLLIFNWNPRQHTEAIDIALSARSQALTNVFPFSIKAPSQDWHLGYV